MTPSTLSPLVSGISENDVRYKLSKIDGLPTPVISWEVKCGIDYSDNPAIYIVPMVKDDDIEDEKDRFDRRFKTRSIIRKLVGDKLVPGSSMYIDFCMPSDDIRQIS